MLATVAAIALLLATVLILGLGVALALAGAVGVALATPDDQPLRIPPRLGCATVAALGVLIFVLATLAVIPQLP